MSENSHTAMSSWTALAERSGDSAFERTIPVEGSVRVMRAKAAWRFASRPGPKPGASRSRVFSKHFTCSPGDSWLRSFK